MKTSRNINKPNPLFIVYWSDFKQTNFRILVNFFFSANTVEQFPGANKTGRHPQDCSVTRIAAIQQIVRNHIEKRNK